MLEVKSIDRGILVPRLTTDQRTGITGPAEGLLVYDSDTDSFWFYSGSVWQELRTGAGTELTDADNDTKVTVDNGSDEDLVRFQLGGTEKMVLRNNSLDLNPGNDNVIVAPFSGSLITSASNNSIFGYSAGQMNATGNYNSFFGSSVGLNNIDGSSNVAMGAYSLFNNTSGSHNVAIGSYALNSCTDISDLVAVGDSALFCNDNYIPGLSDGTKNSAIGSKALVKNFKGYGNTATGYKALYSNIQGFGNTANGTQALTSNCCDANTAVGNQSLYSNLYGESNTSIGYRSLFSNVFESNNTAIGYKAGYGIENSSFSNNTLVGSKAGYSLSTGSDNILIGYQAGDNLTTGSKNIIIGYDIHAKTINGMEEMILGHPDLLYGDITNRRIVIGTPTPQEQLHLKNTGSVTLLLQADSDNDNVDENENPRCELKQDGEVVTGGLGFIGDDGAIYDNSLANSLYFVNEYSTPLQLGTADSVVMTILGNAKVGIGTTDPIQRLDVNGNARFRSVGSSSYTSSLNLTANGTLTTNTSDIRLKTNIETLNGGLERVLKLRGVEFNWKSDPDGKKMIEELQKKVEELEARK